MNIVEILLDVILVLLFAPFVQGGTCWKKVTRSGKCAHGQFYAENMDMDKCCSKKGHVTGWSPHNLSQEKSLFMKLKGNGGSAAPVCHRCHKTCQNVKCRNTERCKMRRGLPKCVCKIKCHKRNLEYKGPVCGNNRRTYRNYCRLARLNCRRNEQITAVYHSKCKRSCRDVRCPGGQHCVKNSLGKPHCVDAPDIPRASCKGVRCLNGNYCIEDQNGMPHCVSCARCPRDARHPQRFNTPMCGTDGATYNSMCELNTAKCMGKVNLLRAYSGPCQAKPTCKTIKCGHRKCLIHPVTSAPRCVLCTNKFCDNNVYVKHTVCGTNNKTYPSFCDLYKEGCETGVDIRTDYSGQCKSEKKNDKRPHTLNRLSQTIKKKAPKKNRRKTKSSKSQSKRRSLRTRKPLPITR